MTDRVAIVLALLVVAALVADFGLNGAGGTYDLARRFVVFLDWIAFWR